MGNCTIQNPKSQRIEKMGKYKKLRLLGKGGMGEVFLVECQDKSRAAMKEISIKGCSETEKAEFACEHENLKKL